MKSFRQLCENESNSQILWNYIVEIKYGQPLVLKERILKNAVLDGPTYVGEIQSGKRWVSGRVSVSRLGQSEFSIHNNVIEGAVWCLEKDRESAKKNLLIKAKQMVENVIATWQQSVADLNI